MNLFNKDLSKLTFADIEAFWQLNIPEGVRFRKPGR